MAFRLGYVDGGGCHCSFGVGDGVGMGFPCTSLDGMEVDEVAIG